MNTNLERLKSTKFNKQTSLMNQDYYRCITFQPEKVITKLLRDGIVDGSCIGRAKREDKSNFYEQYLNIEKDSIPMYAWVAFWYCGNVVFPIDIQTIASSWSYHMGFMQMNNCSIIEFDLPKSDCVLGKHGSLSLCSLESNSDDSIEGVFNHIKLEWVAGIYSPVLKQENT